MSFDVKIHEVTPLPARPVSSAVHRESSDRNRDRPTGSIEAAIAVLEEAFAGLGLSAGAAAVAANGRSVGRVDREETLRVKGA